jgi:hypothetical protein
MNRKHGFLLLPVLFLLAIHSECLSGSSGTFSPADTFTYCALSGSNFADSSLRCKGSVLDKATENRWQFFNPTATSSPFPFVRLERKEKEHHPAKPGRSPPAASSLS